MLFPIHLQSAINAAMWQHPHATQLLLKHKVSLVWAWSFSSSLSRTAGYFSWQLNVKVALWQWAWLIRDLGEAGTSCRYNIICAIMSLNIYIVGAPLSGGVGLGWHLEGATTKQHRQSTAASMVQWGKPRNKRGPKQTGNLPWATAKADSNWSRPQTWTWTWTWTRVRVWVQIVLRFDSGLFAMHSPRRDAGQSGRGSCRLYKISALDFSYRIRFLCAFVIVGIAIVVVPDCCCPDCSFCCCCCWCCCCSCCCALFWFSNLWLS